MKLFYQTHSPYARKVLVFAHESRLVERIEVVHHETSPFKRNESVYAVNPLGQVPVLIGRKDEVLFDSLVICDYLDNLHGGSRLIPLQGEERSKALCLHALGQGICDIGIRLRMEVDRRPVELRYPAYADGQRFKLQQVFQFIEDEIDLEGKVQIGHIGLATALDWIVFRGLMDFTAQPRLMAWYQTFCHRGSMLATAYSGNTFD